MDDELKKEILEEVVDEEEQPDEQPEEQPEEEIEEQPEEQPEEEPEEEPEEQPEEDKSELNNVILSRLDALEERIGELMAQGGVDNSVLEDDTELSDIERENNNWYKRNSIMRNY